MGFIAQAFSEGNGSPSSMRVLSAFVVVTLLGVWAAVSVRQNALQPLTAEQAAIVIGSLGLKAWQRGKEGSKQKVES
jgi:hypothetical protein